ncbi:DUF6779 domain-containing protein [Modestobacter sp. SSW1-42]|uniref:DUF6779 domain-containing protein n=1 Tax=Modestobacter sp. SSW1-42 TaxID=596372 RepID=UPI00398754A8
MGGRRDDDGPARNALPAVPPRPPAPRPRPVPPPAEPAAAERPVPVRPRDEERGSSARRAWLAVGLVLAAVATAAVVLTDNPLVLRIVLLGVCWAFVVAAFLGGSRDSDRIAAAAREAEQRAARELEREREASARHAEEAALQDRLRREAEEAMRGELQQLRTQLSALDRLQDDLAAVGRLRGDLDALAQLSAQLTELTELRGELAGLTQLRSQLTGVGELRTEIGRLRTDGTEQLSGEVLVERTVMRAQSVRGPAQGPDTFGGRTLDGTPDWPAEPPLRTGGWEVDSWTTRVEGGAATDDAEPAPRPLDPPPTDPTRTSAVVDEEQGSRHRPPSPVEWLQGEPRPAPGPAAVPRSPRAWLDERSQVGTGDPTGGLPLAGEGVGPATTAWSPAPEPPRRHRRAAEPDEPAPWADRLRGTTPDESPSSEVASSEVASYVSASHDPSSGEEPSDEGAAYEPPSWLDRGTTDAGAATGSTVWTPAEEPDDEIRRAPEPAAPQRAGHARLEQILAESGVAAPSGARSRRRRYREEGQDEADDVLARVLRRD